MVICRVIGMWLPNTDIVGDQIQKASLIVIVIAIVGASIFVYITFIQTLLLSFPKWYDKHIYVFWPRQVL